MVWLAGHVALTSLTMIPQSTKKVYNRSMTRGKIIFLAFVLFFLVYFSLKGILFLDPDFGWHLTMGRYILAHGVPPTDPFSYTMPSYPFVDHEWLTNVLLSKGVSFLSYEGVASVFGFLTIGALLISLATLKKQSYRFALIPFFLTGMTLYSFTGVRPQAISWFLFAFLLWVVRQETHFLRFRWILPFLFLVWVNLHGSFALGIMTLLLASGYWYMKKKSPLVSSLIVLALCLGATCITPYGYRMWWEVWMQMTDSTLHFTIQEWLPAVFSMDLALWLFAALSVSLVLRSLRKFSFLDSVLYGGLLLAGTSSVRQMPLWLLIALPMTCEALSYFFVSVSTIPEGERRFNIMGRALGGLALLFCLPTLWMTAAGLGMTGGTSMYPDKAVHFLATHQPPGEVFSTYDWGGYLIWKLPSKKVFIDGRMPSWRWNANIAGESNYAFSDYRKFVDNKVSFKQVIRKYHISTFLLPLPGDPKKDQLTNLVMTYGTKLLHLPLRKEMGFTHLVKEAKKAGWQVVYKDDTAIIYQDK